MNDRPVGEILQTQIHSSIKEDDAQDPHEIASIDEVSSANLLPP